MSQTEYTWLNKQGVRGPTGFELQREDHSTMTYREGSRSITIDIENGFIAGRYAVLMSPDALRSWDDGIPLDHQKELQVLANIRDALTFQDLGLSIE